MIKTGALGDVLRTTSLLPGLSGHPAAALTWLTASAALDLVRRHPLVAEALAVDSRAEEQLARLGERLARRRWDWVISLDDEESLCRFAARIPAERLSGAH